MPPFRELVVSLHQPTSIHHPALRRAVQQCYACSTQEVDRHMTRIDSLVRDFHMRYEDAENVAVVRAPGRVNLIGEHTDYNGFPVLPIAIDRDILIAFEPLPHPEVLIANSDATVGARRFRIESPLPLFAQGDWGNYVKAAIQGIMREGHVKGLCGFRALATGNIPESAGLSSSSALVVASALAFLASNRESMPPGDLATLLARAERYVGVESGGMDQAISLMAKPDAALKISFFPLRTESVPFPEGYSIVVSNSLVRAAKSGMARAAYNQRVIEGRLATALLARALGMSAGTPHLLSQLPFDCIVTMDGRLTELAETTLGPMVRSIEDIAAALDETVAGVMEKYCSIQSGVAVDAKSMSLKLLQRVKHVFTEAQRVDRAHDALITGNVSLFGSLMNESHHSCAADYDVSSPELDALVTMARERGALGARLTGAGFGGCTISLIRNDLAGKLIDHLVNEYYHAYIPRSRPDLSLPAGFPEGTVFAVRAAGGGGVVLP